MYHRQVHNQEYQVLEEIGRGSFGSVRKVIHIPTKKLMVRKEIKYGHMNSKERQQLISECKILSQLKFENIVDFYNWDFNDSEKVLYLYMEYCSRGDLALMIKSYKSRNKYIPEKIIWGILAQLLMALHKCHYGVELSPLITIYDRMKPPTKGKNIVIHRDLKPGNIFLSNENNNDDNNDDNDQQKNKDDNDLHLENNIPNASGRGNNMKVDYSQVVVKLGDFGLAKSLETSIQFATTYVGTPYYMSPEVLMDQPYSPLSDIWSLGCVVYEMCSLHPPFQAKTFLDLQNKIKTGKVDKIPEYYSNGLNAIIHSMIDVDLKTRPSTFELLQDIQIRTARKSLQLERFERNLLAYESELVNIEKILEKQATEYERELSHLKEHFVQAVEERVREVINGKKVGKAPESMYTNGYSEGLSRPAYHWQTRYR
ncbi:serine/threonine protein kinase KIN3 NDAI_0G01760 [Naumovozyma dairenensis CBS 421]|uniref:non-specific serine/threonine protein kinase n=1 Tax=Naumovozyma dairenensis (strain ATCC 10597 / BCRC 20456 / CBS 421 / NBRC 0211 / NRRL Y-12639) TaxID=1071378 RepID=G0WDU1_NAUDC|nr:hypothetical protein NDAI_0G01760 [Naumovozyma dairenensis CBS 421]CCD25952.2 hypothetical protein NDAI_0G01760 [Naumovozyma dairenensis CBS 421]